MFHYDGRLSDITERLTADNSKYPKAQDLNDFIHQIVQRGLPRDKLAQSKLFSEAMSELDAAIAKGENGAAIFKNAPLGSLDQITALTGATKAAKAINLLVNGGNATLKDVLKITESGAEHALTGARVVAHHVAQVAGEIPVKPVSLKGDLLGEFRLDLREIHIAPNVGPSIVWFTLHEGVHAATVRALHENAG